MAKKALFVIAKHDFRDEELFHPMDELRKAGIEISIASLEKGECFGAMGGKAIAESSINEVNPKNFDAIVFIGGAGSKVFFENKKALELAKEFFASGKIVAGICIAPSTLANAGILKGKKATSFPSQEKHLKEKGAIFTGKGVEQDGKIITADGPESAREFGKKIVQELKK